MTDEDSRLRSIVNDHTPYAPMTAEEVQRRTEMRRSLKEARSGEHADRTRRERVVDQKLHVPIRPVIHGDKVIPACEMRMSDGGSPYLPVFTSEKRLVEQLGELQTRIEVALYMLIDTFGEENLEIDPMVDVNDWRWTVQTVTEYETKLRRELNSSV